MLKPGGTYEPLGFKRQCRYSSAPAVLQTGVISSLALKRNILDSASKNSVRNISAVGAIYIYIYILVVNINIDFKNHFQIQFSILTVFY